MKFIYFAFEAEIWLICFVMFILAHPLPHHVLYHSVPIPVHTEIKYSVFLENCCFTYCVQLMHLRCLIILLAQKNQQYLKLRNINIIRMFVLILNVSCYNSFVLNFLIINHYFFPFPIFSYFLLWIE